MTAAATSSRAFRLLFVNRRFYTRRIKRRNQEHVIILPCLSLSCGVAQPQSPPLKIAPFCYDSRIMVSVSGVTAAQVFSNPSSSPSLSPGIRSLNRWRSSSVAPPPAFKAPSSPPDRLLELNYGARKSLSGIKIQGIDGAIDTVCSLSIVSSLASASVGLVKPFRSPFPGELP